MKIVNAPFKRRIYFFSLYLWAEHMFGPQMYILKPFDNE